MEYEKWMRQSGARLDKLRLAYFGQDFRGVVAKMRIRKGERFLFVPISSMITLKMAKAAPIGAKLAESKAKLVYPTNSCLATYVLQESTNPASRWKLFLAALPKRVDNFPVFFGDHELRLLQGSPFAGRLRGR